MNTFEDVWRKLNQGNKYRASFALAFLKRSIPFQVKVLRKKHCGSQAVLAERANLTQGVVSRAEDQDYGNLTFNTVGRIAAGLDMAFIGRFVPFSELVKFSQNLSEDEFASIPTFEEEDSILGSLACLEESKPIQQLGNIADQKNHLRRTVSNPKASEHIDVHSRMPARSVADSANDQPVQGESRALPFGAAGQAVARKGAA